MTTATRSRVDLARTLLDRANDQFAASRRAGEAMAPGEQWTHELAGLYLVTRATLVLEGEGRHR